MLSRFARAAARLSLSPPCAARPSCSRSLSLTAGFSHSRPTINQKSLPRISIRTAVSKADAPPRAPKPVKGASTKSKAPRKSTVVKSNASIHAQDTPAVEKAPPRPSTIPPAAQPQIPPVEANAPSPKAPALPPKASQPIPPPPIPEIPPADLPILPNPSVGIWLMVSSTLVLAVIVVGGITRLTESGLSITEWRPVTGILPPMSQDEWEEEFEKYKLTPEFKILNHSIALSDFKRIFYMEWGHRILGRLIGAAFVVPLVYYTLRRRIPRSTALKLGALGLLIGAQGALGWYMVQSGLSDSLLDTPGAVPRVSQYRLAAHLGLAFALYSGMFWTGMGIIKDWRFSRSGVWSGLPMKEFEWAMRSPIVSRFKTQAWLVAGLVLLTALSGAFVAGLDAGLLYNEFPLMGDSLVPPVDELFSPAYAKNADKSDTWWRNIFENPTTVQFNHRVLATTTYLGASFLFIQTLLKRTILPPLTVVATRAAFTMANIQFILGISTLVNLVPVSLAAAHQAGSVLLLTSMIQLLITLRYPGRVAQIWRRRSVKVSQDMK